MGITFVSVGVVFIASVSSGLGVAFIGLGAVYMLYGGLHKKEWK